MSPKKRRKLVRKKTALAELRERVDAIAAGTPTRTEHQSLVQALGLQRQYAVDRADRISAKVSEMDWNLDNARSELRTIRDALERLAEDLAVANAMEEKELLLAKAKAENRPWRRLGRWLKRAFSRRKPPPAAPPVSPIRTIWDETDAMNGFRVRAGVPDAPLKKISENKSPGPAPTGGGIYG